MLWYMSRIFVQQSKAKSQLRISGLSPHLYWLSICTVDWAQFMIVGVFLMLSFFIFQVFLGSTHHTHTRAHTYTHTSHTRKHTHTRTHTNTHRYNQSSSTLYCITNIHLCLQLRPLMEIGALLATGLFLLLYIPIYMLALYIFSYGFTMTSNSQGLIQTLCILVTCFRHHVYILHITICLFIL